MKKYFSELLIVTILISCNTNPTDKLLSDSNKFINDSLLIQLKDPKSFEKIDLKISDTITEVEDLTYRLDKIYSDSEEGYLRLFLKNHIEMIELGGVKIKKI